MKLDIHLPSPFCYHVNRERPSWNGISLLSTSCLHQHGCLTSFQISYWYILEIMLNVLWKLIWSAWQLASSAGHWVRRAVVNIEVQGITTTWLKMSLNHAELAWDQTRRLCLGATFVKEFNFSFIESIFGHRSSCRATLQVGDDQTHTIHSIWCWHMTEFWQAISWKCSIFEIRPWPKHALLTSVSGTAGLPCSPPPQSQTSNKLSAGCQRLVDCHY